ncbi:hypothetical protein FOL80_06255 [Lactobacillus reuteri]|uniref:hypothetical protein n=1 Tax=Limosilactobacillus reuteri TaxID=1598 RepID=UPI00146ED150|nr:hypothetical protein [Limosilactobacillus reuteri]NMV49678.1 hypothetical protein [Limosilactobacillus reuteri]NMV51354.1 hypothetical protein [Limosilactobacillus reuteri]NMV60038.1 hypothetical protein [Limosilactobacillus reuteri]NMV61588.1 hypothetical protein [Limosilactobacillus reuteri]NMV63598.1 hypothetical protein [Limosilactobacillus reuteri]
MCHNYNTNDSNKLISHVRDFNVIFNTQKKDNGYDDGITPNEGILCSLGACEDMTVKMFGKQ